MFVTIWPLFALICTGYVLARYEFPSRDFWPGAERLTYFVLFPSLLVASLSNAPLGEGTLWRFGGATVTTIAIASAALWLARTIRPLSAARFGPVLQGVIRFNTYLALAILALWGAHDAIAQAAIYLALAVPLVNVLSVLALSGEARGLGALGAELIRNPLVMACVIGLTLAATGIGLPFGSESFLRLLGQGSLPLGLLCVGAALRPRALGGDLGLLGVNLALRLLVMPLLAAGIAIVFALGPTQTLVLVLFSAVPTATTSYVLTQQMRGDAPLMAGIVTAQTLVSLATLPLILWAFGVSQP